MVMSAPPAPPGIDVASLLGQLCAAWNAPDLGEVIQIQYSDRLTHNFGHCIPADGRVTVARRLLAVPAVFAEVLTHEVAHLVAWRRHPASRHHGEEWAQLMRDVGYEPRRSLPPLPDDPPTRARTPGYYLHRCALCNAQRMARRPVHRWRCVACHGAGRDGLLQITRVG